LLPADAGVECEEGFLFEAAYFSRPRLRFRAACFWGDRFPATFSSANLSNWAPPAVFQSRGFVPSGVVENLDGDDRRSFGPFSGSTKLDRALPYGESR